MTRYEARPLLATVRNVSVAMSAMTLIAAPASASVDTGGGQVEFSWEHLDSGSQALLNSLDAVSPDVAWIGSSDGVVLRTVDGGVTFTDVSPPDSSEVDFIDIEASSAEDAMLIAIAPTSVSIYRTTDGGETWTVPYVSPDAFFNCMAMFDRRHGFAMGDPVDGKFVVIVTDNAGRSWERVDPAGMPPAIEEEVGLGFAGNCAAATGQKAFFGTSFTPAAARVFRSTDRGLTWEVSSTDDECCVAGLDFRTNKLGLAVGGNVSRTTDGGVTWQLVDADVAPEGFTGDVAWWSDPRGDERMSIPDARRTVFANADGGSYVSRDRGKTWEQIDAEVYYSIDCAEDSETCWATGELGRVARLVVS